MTEPNLPTSTRVPAHSHDHDHDHDHAHGHIHAPANFGRAFAIGTALNMAYVIVEAGFGLYSNSIALIADAGHNLSDVLGLLMAWGASLAVTRPPTQRYTYGFGSTTILASLANAVLLLVAVGAITWEAVRRLGTAEPAAGAVVMTVAAIGIVINGITAWMFMSGRHGDLNIRSAYLHMAADALVSLGVVVAGIAIVLTGWHWLDPLVALIIAGVIVWGTWGLLRQSVDMSLHAVPPGIDAAAVRSHLEKLPGVARVHDLHIWAISTTETAMTCHLVVPGNTMDSRAHDDFIATTAASLRDRFGIRHPTMQIERGEGAACALEPDTVI